MTHPMAGASFTKSSWRCSTDFVEGGTSERDLRDERGGLKLTPQRSETYCRTTFQYQPIPVGQFDTRRGWRLLHHPFQLLLLRLVKGGGEPPVCSKIKAAGPPSPKAAAHRPIVCGSRSSASAVAAALKPWASSSMAYHRSRSPPGRQRQYHPPPQVLHSHLPLFQRPVYLSHAHHQPPATPETS